jgi:hypothetical protein
MQNFKTLMTKMKMAIHRLSHTNETRITRKEGYLILLIRNHMKLVSLFID